MMMSGGPQRAGQEIDRWCTGLPQNSLRACLLADNLGVLIGNTNEKKLSIHAPLGSARSTSHNDAAGASGL